MEKEETNRQEIIIESTDKIDKHELESIPTEIPSKKETPKKHFVIKPKRQTYQKPIPKIRIPQKPVVPTTIPEKIKTKSRRRKIPFPVLLIGYLQVLFNTSISCILIYFVLKFIRIMQRDISIKMNEKLAEIKSEIEICKRLYSENKCMPDQRVPAMENQCLAWERKMNSDPTAVRLSNIFAETLGGILNSFFEPISYKSLIFVALGLIFFILISNYTFGYAKKSGENFYMLDTNKLTVSKK
eukprot:GHVP01026745.1.p1 GENE.GHVP01026745.1~~GHVP01026745.1.p1  ORF type:complete len:271 (-),score=44.38 GHVP01026745.1:1012-1737(-)